MSESSAIVGELRAAVLRATADELNGQPNGDIIVKGCEAAEYVDPEDAASAFVDSIVDEIRPLIEAQGRALAEVGRPEVRCDGCGSKWTDADLERARAEKPGLLSCCPERKPLTIDQWKDRASSQDQEIAGLREELRRKTGALSKAQRTIGHRDRRIDRLWAAIEDARAKGYRLPAEDEPPVVLSSTVKLCPHAPTYDAGLCCGHPDDCTFISPSALSPLDGEA